MFGNAKSEIDVNIKGKDIPKVTWICLGIAILLIAFGICVSFILRGSITVHRAMADMDSLEMGAQMYTEEMIGVENE